MAAPKASNEPVARSCEITAGTVHTIHSLYGLDNFAEEAGGSLTGNPVPEGGPAPHATDANVEGTSASDAASVSSNSGTGALPKVVEKAEEKAPSDVVIGLEGVSDYATCVFISGFLQGLGAVLIGG